MWQFQWIISLVPESILSLIYWIIIAVGITGIAAGWLGRWIPFYGNYVKILKPVGVLLVVLGVWLRGGYDVEMSWRAKVAEMEDKVRTAEAQATAANRGISEDVNKKTAEVKQKTETIVKYIDRYRDREVLKTIEGPERVRIEEVIRYVENCPIPQEFIIIHNDAARLNKKPEEEKK
jgi:hypothetical protein